MDNIQSGWYSENNSLFLNTVFLQLSRAVSPLVISLYAAHIPSFPAFVIWLGNSPSCEKQEKNKY